MRFPRILLAIALICACRQSYADIRKSPWADPRPRPHVPELISESGIGLPSSLSSDQDVYLFITITTNERKVTLVLLARRSVDPKKVAAVLERVTRLTSLPHRTVYWEHAGDYSIAYQNVSPMYFLSRRLDISMPVGALVLGIKSAGMHPHALLRIDGGYEVRGLEPSPVTIEGYRWYNVSRVPADMVSDVSIPLPCSLSNSVKAVGLLSAFPLTAFLFLVLAIIMGRSKRIPANRRRSWYTGVYAGGISFVLICFCVAVFTVWEKASTALLAVTSSGIVLLFVVPAEALLMLSMLAAGWFIGLRILPPPANGTDQKELFPLIPIWWIVMMAAFQPLYRFVSHQAAGFSVVTGAVILVGFLVLWLLLGSRMAWLWVKSRLALCAVDEELTARAREIASRMNVSIKDVRIDPTENGRCYANAMVFIRQGYLIVTRKSLDVLAPEQLDWVLAHEVAHVKDGYPRARGLLGLGLLVFALQGLIAMLRRELSVIGVVSEIVALVAVVIVYVVLDSKYSRQQELAADRKALIATNSLRPAEAALIHIARESPDPRLAEKDTTHPALSKRLAALRETATELGIPAELPGAPGQS